MHFKHINYMHVIVIFQKIASLPLQVNFVCIVKMPCYIPIIKVKLDWIDQCLLNVYHIS